MKTDPFACTLFTFNGNLVAIDFVGAGIPLLACLILAVYTLVKGSFRVNLRRFIIYAVLTTCLGLVTAGEYTVWDYVYGGLSISGYFLFYTILVPVGVVAFLVLDRAKRPTLFFFQVYMVGTTGMVLSDLFRIFSGALDVSPEIIGAGGPLDGIFLGGFVIISGYLIGAVFYVIYTRWKSDYP